MLNAKKIYKFNLPKDSDFIEIGGGEGDLSYFLMKNGFKIILFVEPDIYKYKVASKKLGNIDCLNQDISKIGNIIKDVREMINKHSDIDTSQSILVAFNSFNSSSIDFFIRAYTNPVEWEAFHLIKEDILFKIHEIISEHNADIAFPSRTVYVENSN